MQTKIKQKSEEQALQQLTMLCSQSEHSEREIEDKIRKWNLEPEVQAHIMQYLLEENYIDNLRYCRAFIHDKMEYNHWGQKKIEQALWLKGIDRSISTPLFAEIEEKRWIDILQPLIAQKRRSTKGRNEWEINQKLLRFAYGRGFTFNQAKACLDYDDIEEDF